MSFGFSVTDLTTSIELAFKIYRLCFERAHRADVEYLQFGRDIQSLGEGLNLLKSIIRNAEEQHPRKAWHTDETDYIDAATSHTLREVTGDFGRTIRDCQTLLSDNTKFQRSKAGFVTNVVWHISTQRDVIHLRQRVHFHMVKINFIAKPFELQLLLGIHRELQRLRRDVAELKTLHVRANDSREGRPINGEAADRYCAIPDEIAERFAIALSEDSPPSYHHEGDLPLREGFDALVYHVTNSTVNFKPSLGRGQNVPEDKNYLNLLKSKWIQEKLQQSEAFRAIGSESLWKRYMTEIEDEIADQIVRFEKGELAVPPPETLCRLPDQCFSIWIAETKPRPATQADQRPNEEKILETAIHNPNEALTTTLSVFAQGHVAFRLVSTTKDEQNGNFRESEVEVNMNFTRLVPTFAVSQDYSTNNDDERVYLYGNQGQERSCFSFQNLKDVANFQRALTNYCVSYDTSGVSWHIEFETLAKPSLSGEARLQLWYLKPLPGLDPSGESTPTENLNASVAGVPQAQDARLRRFWTSGTSRTLSSSIVSPIRGTSGDGIALKPPELPALLVYTKCDERYAILHIKLDISLEVKKQGCRSCWDTKTPCSRVLITSKSKRLIIRRLSAKSDHENGLESLDLARFRYPEHSKFGDLEVLPRVKYLSMHFADVEARNVFCTEVESLEDLRDIDLMEYDGMLREKRHRAKNPRSP